ncbi:RHS repeat-associated core domain-containing protein [Paenibacillus sp. FSL L8-0494]|uniref:RHS repeat-associated core domain-containing protein n=1 Tax=Paenibacillus sp. FSL L8-0494 TaxID=2975352 RepID=UPI0030F7875A
MKKDKTASKDYYYLYNGHGDVVQMVDTSGAVVNSYAYDVWGNITSQKEEIPNPFKYTGEVYDEETGLYYLRARYYDPSMGRFLNEDTYEGQIDNPLSQNLYTYVENNPLIYSDPSGHQLLPTGTGYSNKKMLQHCMNVGASTCWNEFRAGTIEASMAIADFMYIDDINTVLNPDASGFDKGLALLGFIPATKIVKSGKLIVKLVSKEGRNIERVFKIPQIVNFIGDGVKHVSQRHIGNVIGWEHKSKWIVTGGEWRTYTRSTVREADRVSLDGDRFIYEKEFKKAIGVDVDGNNLYKVRVVLEQDGSLITSFPQLDWKK